MPEAPAPGGFASLAGWEQDDIAAAFACFRRTAEAIVGGAGALRPALTPDPALIAVCRAALGVQRDFARDTALAFFTDHFEPRAAGAAGDAFLTGFYEPVVDGALQPSAAFSAPLFGQPGDLVTFAADAPKPAWAAAFSAARRLPGGELVPYPDRATIEAEAASFRPVAWVRDRVEAFLIQVQGSARVRLPDGRLLRLTYAGRNGHPYTSVGRLLIERGAIAPADMTLARLKAWFRANGQAPGETGRALLDVNRSFIFFEATPGDDGEGPTAGAGVELTPLRSIAVDRTRWCYGLPFWVEAIIPWQGPEPTPFRRLMIAQDTGSAIVGPARLDIFFGSGDDAGARAGDIRHPGTLTVLQPRSRV